MVLVVLNTSYLLLFLPPSPSSSLLPPSASLDLGGIAKGWALDEMASRLKREGWENAYLDW